MSKHRLTSDDLIDMDVPMFSISDTLLSYTPLQNTGSLVGVQPVRLFDMPKTVRAHGHTPGRLKEYVNMFNAKSGKVFGQN